MKKTLLNLSMLLLFMIVGLGSVWAEDVVYKTALFGPAYNSKGISSYTGTFSSTNDEFTVDLEYFNNNNNGWAYVKTGNKTNASVGTITTNSAIDKAVTKIAVTIDAITALNVNNITLYSGTSANACTTSEGTFDKSKGVQTVTISSPSANKFYKISFDCKQGSSNGLVQVSKVEYYVENDGTTPETPTTYNINIDDKVAGGTISANPTTATEGTEVTLTATPSEGYEFTSWYVLDSDAEEITVTDNKFSMPASDVEVSATFTKIPEEDAPTSFYFKKVESQADIKYGETYIIVCEGEGTAMGSQSTNRRNNASVSINNGKIVTNVNGEGKPYEVTLISGSDGEYGMKLSNGRYLGNGAANSNYLKDVERVANGYYWTLTYENGNVTMKTNHATPRYLCVNTSNKDDSYATYTSIGSYKPVTLYKKVVTSLTITLNPACHDEDGMVYSTFSSSKPFVVSKDIEVSEIAIVDGELLVESYDPGDIVPANTGVMVSALEGGNYEVEVSDKSDAASVLGEDNRLRPSGDTGITADKMAAADADCTYFRLTMHNGTQIGYWWGAEDGAAFDLAANKAYLAVPNSAEVKSNLWFSGNATSVSIPKAEAENATIYNLAGQRVSTATKGLYIKNGKKYMVK